MTKTEMLEIVHEMRALLSYSSHLSGRWSLKNGEIADDARWGNKFSLQGALAVACGYGNVNAALREHRDLVRVFETNNPHDVWTVDIRLPEGATFEMVFETLRLVEKAIHDQG